MNDAPDIDGLVAMLNESCEHQLERTDRTKLNHIDVFGLGGSLWALNGLTVHASGFSTALERIQAAPWDLRKRVNPIHDVSCVWSTDEDGAHVQATLIDSEGIVLTTWKGAA